MAAKPTHIVDASALIAYFKNEEGHEKFADFLLDERNVLAIHVVNLCELYHDYLRSDGIDVAEEAWRKAASMLAIVEKTDEQFIKRVARWKVDHGLSLTDAFAAATAEEYACRFVTTDRNDFKAVENAGVLEIMWLR